MSEDDYINRLKVVNAKLFRNSNVKIRMAVDTFENELRKAYRAGAGDEQGKKSIFDQLFGTSKD